VSFHESANFRRRQNQLRRKGGGVNVVVSVVLEYEVLNPDIEEIIRHSYLGHPNPSIRVFFHCHRSAGGHFS
jgi:hypothetical protein